MPRRKSSQLKAVRQDNKGRYFRNLGYVKSGTGSYSQRKFYLGHDEDHAKLASARLEALWTAIKAKHGHAVAHRHILTSQRYLNYNTDVEFYRDKNGDPQHRMTVGKPIWTDLTLVLAEAIRQGGLIARIPDPIVKDSAELQRVSRLTPHLVSGWLDETRRTYPMIHIELANSELGNDTNALLKERGKQLLTDGTRLTSEPLTNQKIHHAIESYCSHVRTTTIDSQGETTEWGNAKVRQITFVKNHVPNVDLSQFGRGSIEAFLTTLAGRPNTKRGKPSSKSFVKSCFKELKVFLKWLDNSSRYSWEWPVGFEYKTPRVADSAGEQLGANISRQRKIKTYNIGELSTIYQYATPVQRLYALLCLNCGFANAEITTLLFDDIFIRQPHPDEDLFRLDCGNEHSWIARTRTKSSVLGTWKLWPATVTGIEWWLHERARLAANYEVAKTVDDISFKESAKGRFFVTSQGKPFAEKNRRTGKIPNSWNSLIGRIQNEIPDFKRLSFKYLRKTGSSFIREEGSGELARVYLSHGKPYEKDENLEVYANRPYRQMFEVLDTFNEQLAPVWALVEEPFPAGRKLGGKDKLTPEKSREIQEMRGEGASVAEIAETLGVNKSTVYRRAKASVIKPG